jgi:SAM-dependent methyltransferase
MNYDDQRALASQLRCPTGEEGIAVGEKMKIINAVMNQVAFEHLDAGPPDRVLEIGFGLGSLLDQFLSRSSYVSGLDLSLTMAKETSQRLGARVKICCGSVLDLPFEEHAFTKICTVNTVYFWKNLLRAFTECRRVLEPNGVLVVCFNADYELAKDSWDKFNFTLYGEGKVMDSMHAAGFIHIDPRIEQDLQQGKFFCLRAS